MNNVEISSKELKEATEIPSSLTSTLNVNTSNKDLTNEIRTVLTIKNSSLTKAFDMGSLMRNNNDSGNVLLKNLIQLLRDYYIIKYKQDNIKDLTSRKLFDNMILSLECLMVNNIEVTSEEVGSLILGFLSKKLL